MKITRKPFDTSKIYAKGKILWPVIFKDKRYFKDMRKIENILKRTGDKNWRDICDFKNAINSMVYTLKNNIDEYPAAYYGKARVFLNDLQRIFS